MGTKGLIESLQLFEKPNVLIKYTIDYIHVYCGDMWSIWRQEFEHSLYS